MLLSINVNAKDLKELKRVFDSILEKVEVIIEEDQGSGSDAVALIDGGSYTFEVE